MSEVNIAVESQTNEVFGKTIVIQKFRNPFEQPLELIIYIDKKDNIFFNSFSSFQAKIGDLIMVKSKVTKKEKAEIKYTDSISSGNSPIFVCEKDDKIIINMGNIPAKEEVIFISEFIQFTKHLQYFDLYESEIFGKFPIFEGKEKTFYNGKLKGKIHIKTKNKIFSIKKNIYIEKLNIAEENYINEEKNEYLISFEVEKMPKSYFKSDKSSKIYFNTNYNEPIVFLQKSSTLNEDNYTIQLKIKDLIDKNEKEILYSELHIYISSLGNEIKNASYLIAKKAFQFFLRSLPVKSRYNLCLDFPAYELYNKKKKKIKNIYS